MDYQQELEWEATQITTAGQLLRASMAVFHKFNWSIKGKDGRTLKITGISDHGFQARSMMDGTGDTFWITDLSTPVFRQGRRP